MELILLEFTNSYVFNKNAIVVMHKLCEKLVLIQIDTDFLL